MTTQPPQPTTSDNAQGTLAATSGALMGPGLVLVAQGVAAGFPAGEFGVTAGLVLIALGTASAWIRAYLRAP